MNSLKGERYGNELVDRFPTRKKIALPHERYFREDEAEVSDLEDLTALAKIKGEATFPSVGVTLA